MTTTYAIDHDVPVTTLLLPTSGPVATPPRRPFVLLASSWPWRSLAYLGVGMLVGFAWLAAVISWISLGFAAFFIGGLVLVAVAPLAGIPLAAFERRMLRLMGYPPIPSPHRAPPAPGLWQWYRMRMKESATWRELGYALLLSVLAFVDLAVATVVVSFIGALISLPFLRMAVESGALTDIWVGVGSFDAFTLPWGVLWSLPIVALVLLFFSGWPLTVYARGRAALASWLLAPPVDTAALTQSRARIVGTFDAERQRIERDIHDGPQQQLTALLMTLGMAKEEATDAPDGLRALIADAQQQARTALDDLRNLVQGIHPSLLTDRGLVAAVEAMTRQLPIDVTLTAEVNEPVPQHIEVAAYFVISEALTNVARHSGSASASVLVRTDAGRLIVAVTDNGVGGAQPGGGSGLVGMDDRVQAIGGTMTLTSPTGGPTVLRVELPCA